jgi:uncharacterized membrane protein
MDLDFVRFWTDMVARLDGPLHFRLILQPAMAVFFGIRDGFRFAREGRSFLLWGGPKDPAERTAQFWSTCRAIGKVFFLAIVLDVIYQLWVLHWVYVPQLLFVAVVLALAPYLLVRGAVNLLARIGRGRRPPEHPS